MIIYGNRPPELDYLIPMNFLWPTQHNLGDHDNYLFAFDAAWRISPGLTLYQTLFMDELAWVELFKDWWGNKYVYQAGLHITPNSEINLPDLRLELSIARPWTYTHDDSVNNYTSANLALGLPQGPNSQSIFVESTWWLSPRWFIKGSYLWLKQGTGLGSNASDNYGLRDRDLDYNTPFLLGEVERTYQANLDIQYKFSQMIDVVIQGRYDSKLSEGIGKIALVWEW
jgi:hypothetical protein